MLIDWPVAKPRTSGKTSLLYFGPLYHSWQLDVYRCLRYT